MPLTQAIKFSPYGGELNSDRRWIYPVLSSAGTVPYISEFDNVQIRRSTSRSSISKASQVVPDGLFIHFPSSIQSRKTLSTRRRIRRLKETIAEAVVLAGMDSPPANEQLDPMERTPSCRMRGLSTVSAEAGSLFRGTYGQVVAALRSAGLSITPCADTGFGDGVSLPSMWIFHPWG